MTVVAPCFHMADIWQLQQHLCFWYAKFVSLKCIKLSLCHHAFILHIIIYASRLNNWTFMSQQNKADLLAFWQNKMLASLGTVPNHRQRMSNFILNSAWGFSDHWPLWVIAVCVVVRVKVYWITLLQWLNLLCIFINICYDIRCINLNMIIKDNHKLFYFMNILLTSVVPSGWWSGELRSQDISL